MKPSRILTLVATLAVALFFGAPEGALAQEDGGEDGRRPGVAVFPFTNGGSYGESAEDLEALTVGLQQMLLTELDQNDALRIVERARLKQILEEQDLAEEGRVDPSTAAEIGKLVGARYMVTGVFVDLYGDFRMDARIIDVETGEVIQTESVKGEKQGLYALLVDLSSQIAQGADLPALPAEVAQQRKEKEIPPEAVTIYSQAQVYQDRGRTEQAIELYQRLTQRFPDLTEAKEALDQLQSSQG